MCMILRADVCERSELRLHFLLIIDRLDGNKPGRVPQSTWELRLCCLSPTLSLPFIAVRLFFSCMQTHTRISFNISATHTPSCDTPRFHQNISQQGRGSCSFTQVYCEIHKKSFFGGQNKQRLKMSVR